MDVECSICGNTIDRGREKFMLTVSKQHVHVTCADRTARSIAIEMVGIFVTHIFIFVTQLVSSILAHWPLWLNILLFSAHAVIFSKFLGSCGPYMIGLLRKKG